MSTWVAAIGGEGLVGALGDDTVAEVEGVVMADANVGVAQTFSFLVIAIVFLCFYMYEQQLNRELKNLIQENSWRMPVYWAVYTFLAWLLPVISQMLSINFSFKEKMKAV